MPRRSVWSRHSAEGFSQRDVALSHDITGKTYGFDLLLTVIHKNNDTNSGIKLHFLYMFNMLCGQWIKK